MVFVSLLAGLTLSASAENCPNLTGWYTCFEQDTIRTERVSQEVVDGVTVYTIETVSLDTVETVDENGQPKIEYVPLTKTYTYPANNQARPTKEDNFDGTMRAKCEDGSLIIYVVGTFFENGAPTMDTDTLAKLSATDQEFKTEYSGSFTFPDGSQHTLPAGQISVCTRTGSR
jgi:hypothetical protein